MKKICILLALSLMSSLCTAVFAIDYSGHWAEDTIDALISDGIVSGDENGMIRPDDHMLRAELVKVVNKSFGYTDKGTVNFPDVEAGKWYENDFLIAKRAGYLTGDELGNANPDSLVTRAEVCVILARILGLIQAELSRAFTDEGDIPDWARGYIGALVGAGLISGYPDGSFRSDNVISRAEAFSLTIRVINSRNSNWENSYTPPVTGVGMAMVNGHSGGGGGGGGGGNGSSAVKIGTPFVTLYLNQTITFKGSDNASGYTIKLTTGLEEMIIDIPDSELVAIGGSFKADISKYITRLCEETELAVFTLEIYVKARAKSGYADSDYSRAGTQDITLPHIESPKTVWQIRTENQEEIVYILWESVEFASGYDVKLYLDGQPSTAAEIDLTLRQIRINGALLENKTVKVEIRAISGNSGYKSSPEATVVPNMINMAGAGTDEEPYIIRTVEHYSGIRDLSAVYVIVNNLNLEDCTPLGSQKDPFTGKLIGRLNYTEGSKATLTINYQSSGFYLGLVSYLGKGGLIENIITEGNVSGTAYVGGVAGGSEGTIRGCVNKAKISASSTNVGGIVGINNGGIVELCANLASIIGSETSTQWAGGVCGTNDGIVRTSYNSGMVSGYRQLGGVCGRGYEFGVQEISNCYNAGIVSTKQPSTSYLAGICHSFTSSYVGESVLLYNNYNAGVLDGGTASSNGHIYNSTSVAEGAVIRVSENYYITPNLSNKALEGTVPLTDGEMRALSSFAGFSEDIWEIAPESGYPYPQIKGNPHYELAVILDTPKNIMVSNRVLTFTGDENAIGYQIKITKDDTELYNDIIYEATLNVSEYFKYNGDYTVTVQALAALGTEYRTSAEATFEITYQDGLPPVGNLSGFSVEYQSNDTYLVKWTAYGNAQRYQVTVGNQSDTSTVYTSEFTLEIGDGIDGRSIYTVNVEALDDSDNALALGNALVDARYAGGEGSVESPYLITNLRQLKNVALNTASCFLQREDIAEPLTETIAQFSGIYKGDGADRKIITLDIRSTASNQGLFGALNGGTVENIITTGYVSGTLYIGGIAGASTGSIVNCANEAEIAASSNYAGGITGNNKNLIELCANAGYINTSGDSQWIGGIAGLNNGVIRKSFNSGDVYGKRYIGGIAGEAYNTTGLMEISNCYNSGSILYSTSGAGGITYNVGTTTNKALTVVVVNNYNIGYLDPLSSYRRNIFSDVILADGGTSNVSGNYYCSALSGRTDNAQEGVSNLTEAQMESLDIDSSIWEIVGSGGYKYPQLIGNYHIEKIGGRP